MRTANANKIIYRQALHTSTDMDEVAGAGNRTVLIRIDDTVVGFDV